MGAESKRFKTPQHWNTGFTEKPYFSDLIELMPLRDCETYPNIDELNSWADRFGLQEYYFIADAESQQQNSQDLYYEQFIFEKQLIPTRANNWHDLFNAIIWCLFPKTKRTLNKIHINEIQQHGLNPRTPVRNRVTHFDECGGILVYQEDEHLQMLQNHLWSDAFCHKRDLWGVSTKLFIFGHANYEMLLDPYIGLTGKYLPIKVQNNFQDMSLAAQYQWLDDALLNEIQQAEVFAQKGQLKPIPLLGIPGWWPEQSQAFYSNINYFRPKRLPV